MSDILRFQSEMDDIAAPAATIEKVAGGFQFTEGPIWTRDGALLFSDIAANTIYRWAPGRGTTAFREHCGSETDVPPEAMAGPNGLTLDAAGGLLICEHGNRRLTRLAQAGSLTVVADRFEGKRLNSPNDVVCSSDGSIWFTDPPYGLRLRDRDPAKELPFNGIYRVRGTSIELVSTELTRPNGLAFSPDERFLYVSNPEFRS